MRELLGEGAGPGGDEARAEVTLEAADGPALLADWLAELALLAEMEGVVPDALTSLEVDEASLRAAVRGRRTPADHLVKAVTYHGLVLEPGWRATVVFDV
jgi:SHS2 domain-containing protein